MFTIFVDGELLHDSTDSGRVIVSPKLTVEMGKAGSFEFGLPPTHAFYDKLKKLKSIVTVELDDVEIFRGRVYSYERGFNNVKNVYCEGNLSYLVDAPQKTEKYSGTTHGLFRKIIEAYNKRVEPEKQFVIGRITIDDKKCIVAGTSEEKEEAELDYNQIVANSVAGDWPTTLNYIESTLTQNIGGYLVTRRENGISYIDLVKEYTQEATQSIRFGENILDLTEEVNPEELFTVLIPLGDENLTIASVNGGKEELVDEEAVAQYGRIVKTHSFDSVNEAKTLLENAKLYLKEHSNIPITYTITAIDLNLANPDITPIYLGDKVNIESMPHHLSEKMTCTKIEYDIYNPSNNVYTFGNQKQSLTERYNKNRRKDNDTAEEKARKGGGGGKKAADEATEEKLEEFYDAWCTAESGSGKVNIGGVYRAYEDLVHTLQRKSLIEVDSKNGTVHIGSYFEEADKKVEDLSDNLIATRDELIASSSAQINTLADKTHAEIQMEATYWGSKLNSTNAKIKLLADDMGSKIQLLADQITLKEDSITTIIGSVDVSNLKIYGLEESIANMKNGTSQFTKLWSQNIDSFALKTAGITIAGKRGNWKDLTIVKSFTQASGETASGAAVTQQTILVSGSVQTATHVPSEGQTITF